MTGETLQTRDDKVAAPDSNLVHRYVRAAVCAPLIVVMLLFSFGCQQLSPYRTAELPVPEPVLDTTQLDSVRFQSPGSGSSQGSGSSAGTPGLLNSQSHRVKLEGPVINIEDSTDKSQLIAAVNFRGNTSIQTHQLKRNISTRPGRFYDPDKLQQDVQTLWQMDEIERINGPYIEQSPNGVSITFDIEERNAIGDIEFIGNRGISDSTIRRESGLDEIDRLDVHRIRMAKTRIEELYRERGYPRTQVEVTDGNEADDSKVVFLIHEDQQQRIWKVDFEGNTIASDGRLKSFIEAKPGILKLIGGLAKKEQIDQDIVRLESYYKSLGYFNVQIGRDISESNDGRWLSIRFIINEGPRYKVREVRFVGNEHFASEDLIRLLELKPGADGQPEFNSARMSQDTVALRDLYGENGFVFADVQAEPRFLEEPGHLDMVYRISEGEQYRVGQINVNYNGGNGITRREVVLNRLSLRPGDLIDSRKLRNDEIRLGSARIFSTGQEAGGQAPRIVVKPAGEEGSSTRTAQRSGGGSGTRAPQGGGSGSRSQGSGSRF